MRQVIVFIRAILLGLGLLMLIAFFLIRNDPDAKQRFGLAALALIFVGTALSVAAHRLKRHESDRLALREHLEHKKREAKARKLESIAAVHLERLDGACIRCHRVVKDVVEKRGPLHLVLGDLFVTSAGLIYLQYGSVQHSGAEDVLYAVAGGIVGSLSRSLQKHSAFRDLLKRAQSLREQLYGMGIEDRIRALPEDVTVLRRQEVHSVDADGQPPEVVLTCTGRTLRLTMSSAEESVDALRQWLSGTLADQPDDLGVNLRYLGVRQLLQVLAERDASSQIDSEAIARQMSDRFYVAGFVSRFYEMEPQAQVRAATTLGGLPEPCVADFRARVVSYLARARVWLSVAAVWLLVDLAAVALFVHEVRKRHQSEVWTAVWIVFIASLPVALVILSVHGSKYVQHQRVLSALKVQR